MAKLIYSAIASLDGFIEDADGKFEWAAPDHEVHAFVNKLERPIGTMLFGRRMYETLVVWETIDTGPDRAAVSRDFAEIWRAAEKIVYSSTLPDVSSARTRLQRSFDPGEVARLKASASRDISIGGPALAAAGIAAGLVDEVHLFLCPVTIGAGKRALPDDIRLDLELLDERRFAGGVVYLRYRLKR